MFSSVNSHLDLVFLFYLLKPIFNFQLTQYKKSETNPLLIQQHFQLDLFDKIVKPILVNGCEYGEWEITTLLKEFCKILLYVDKNNRRVPWFYGIRRIWQISFRNICYNFGLSIIGVNY